MSEARVTSAPGKLILSGEYAVLDGAPAVVMAVDRRARVCVRDAPAGVLRVRTDTTAAAKDYRPGSGLALVDAVLAETGVRGGIELGLDTRAFRGADGNKLGIGSSAALCAALCAALGGSEATAYRAHRRFQGGSGSGVDVAAAWHGGLIRSGRDGEGLARLAWPAGLQRAILASGVAADTRTQLARFAALGEDCGGARRAFVAAAQSLPDVWQRGDAATVLAAMRRYVQSLTRFDADAGLGIFGAGHAAMYDPDDDVVYKPCGAGAGDLGLALATDADKLLSFVARAEAAGFAAVDLRCDGDGIRRDAT